MHNEKNFMRIEFSSNVEIVELLEIIFLIIGSF